ncbi:hypothetical protein FNO01nite_16500 [Flavobacterium noncentrifugens]|uniref:Tetratricopeptide repeat-containing protein n=1 Tax=Flavobacterium noncentrifugens TaxID=1128970 RepID=A0A1G8WLW2_9FLAO|nr:tetratricopeptide repeat protein [Flavobacterium noncentrifugens]GEP50978.1 hypothetical protein FNO01nite_16500 [Flavobacterium noncentrifugens]SDJ79107.1 hypothetical protein SAMN04487935_1868 [Flavobacterium noncentrifugens]
MTVKIYFALLSTVLFQSAIAQPDGYWDKERATSKEIILGAGNRVAVKSEDLPVGTTEVVYRITLLDENQQMANSLVSLLKAIPDPTGISQGSAGAVFLLSKASGDDKCKYAIFNAASLATAYFTSGKTDKACFFQETPLNKDAKRLTVGKSSCLQSNSESIWFGFESQNWVMKQKIVLEIVPWVNNKLGRGWNPDSKNDILKICNSLKVIKKVRKKDQFCNCFLNAIVDKYTYREFSQLLAVEKSSEIESFTVQCLKKSGETYIFLDPIRDEANKYFIAGKTEQAIQLLQHEIFDKGYAVSLDYDTLGNYYLLSKQFAKAENTFNKGFTLDNSELSFQLNLAHIYLFTDRVDEAKEIHKKYKFQNVLSNLSWKQQTEKDFAEFKKRGFPDKDFKKILRILD